MLRTKFFQFFGLEKFVFSNYVIFLDSCLPAVLVIHAIMYYTKNTKKYIFLVFWELFGHCRRLNLALYCRTPVWAKGCSTSVMRQVNKSGGKINQSQR